MLLLRLRQWPARRRRGLRLATHPAQARRARPRVRRRRAFIVGGVGTKLCNSCAGPVLNQLWVEKHKPLSVAQLVGNGKLISDLRGWLNEWQRCDPRGNACAGASD